MAGNEIAITEFLFNNIGIIKLKHLGTVKELALPLNDKLMQIKRIDDLRILATEDAGKKADIYINNFGVSLKQTGASFPFNRLQRAEIINVFEFLKFSNPTDSLSKIDKAIDNFHKGLIKGRSRPWKEIFNQEEFKKLTEFLMTKGSPNRGYSKHPASYILEAPKHSISQANIKVYTFGEYFDEYIENIKIAIRRQWIGQASDSEHNRALGLSKKEDNKRWVYSSIIGEPRVSKKTLKKWREDFSPSQRRTVYMLYLEKT